MGAKDISEIMCWQLARGLNQFVCAVTARPKVASNRKFCDQAETAAASAARNIAEGFGRYDRKEFAQFVKVAIASIQETRSIIFEAFDRGYVTVEERDAGLQLTLRTLAAATRLRRHLVSTPASNWKSPRL